MGGNHIPTWKNSRLLRNVEKDFKKAIVHREDAKKDPILMKKGEQKQNPKMKLPKFFSFFEPSR
jgi:hypothetical protein